MLLAESGKRPAEGRNPHPSVGPFLDLRDNKTGRPTDVQEVRRGYRLPGRILCGFVPLCESILQAPSSLRHCVPA